MLLSIDVILMIMINVGYLHESNNQRNMITKYIMTIVNILGMMTILTPMIVAGTNANGDTAGTNDEDDDEDDAFSPVISSGQLNTPSQEGGDKDGVFIPEDNELQVGFLDNMSRLLKNSLSPQGIAEVGGGTAGKKVTASATQPTQKEGASASAAALEGQLTDLKGRCKYIFLCVVCVL